ncbi:MAG: pyridoxamine 5'-phosphate oxidase family protein [Acidobacteria bacterium]|nr:pyridoxamine 5'-phosphate oxidase family protein [Acidobacteriota bacterium]
MRRGDRELSEAEALDILARAEWGVLATVDLDGWPYAIPMNHALLDGGLILHSAPSGHKLDNLAGEAKVSYCVVTAAEALPLELSTRYESAVVFGRARILAEPGEKAAALRALGLRFAPGHPELVERELAKNFARTAALRIEIERVTGKARR